MEKLIPPTHLLRGFGKKTEAHLQVCKDHHPRILVITLLLFVLGIHTVPLGLGQGQEQAETPPRTAVSKPLPQRGQEPLKVPALLVTSHSTRLSPMLSARPMLPMGVRNGLCGDIPIPQREESST